MPNLCFQFHKSDDMLLVVGLINFELNIFGFGELVWTKKAI